jgi:ATP/maltotriose-dependent transcriptional regulator MalT/DNA-binding SARP family transcriptional activator
MASLTKISTPRSSGIVPRERLFRLIDEGLRRTAVWVASPAGSGKTSLAASYLETRNINCLWYKADSGDGDIATFFYYMGLAARKAAARFRKPLPLLTPEYVLGIPEFARRYFEILFERLKPPFVIVLDNYHEIPAESQFHEIMKIGLANAPEGIHIIVLSRNTAPAAYARLLANNTLSRLGWEQVQLTAEESRRIVQAKAKQALAGETLALLHQKAQGWVAGLMLLIEGSKVQLLDPERLNRFTPEDIFDYFATEIFRKSDPQEQAFLLATAFLPSMTAQTAEAFTGNTSAGKILCSLNERNYFTERHLKDRPIFLYHPLFREFLQSKAREQLPPEKIAILQREAAAVLIKDGQAEDGALLLMEAEDWSGFIALFTEQAPVLMSTGRSRTIAEWLGKIPGAIVQRTPWLLYWSGICRLPISPAESRRFLEDAFRRFESHADDAGMLLAWSAIVQTYLFEFDDFRPLDRWIDWLDERLRRGASFPSVEIEASVAAGMTGALTWRMPAHPAMHQWVARALSLSRSSANPEAGLRSRTNAAVYYIWTGMFDECAILIGEMTTKIRSEPVSPLRRISMKVPESMFYNTAVEFREQATRSVQEGLEIAQQTGVRIVDPLLYIQGVVSALNEGDPQKAEEFLLNVDKTLRSASRTHVSHYYCLLAWHQLFTGNTQKALLLAEKSLAVTKETGVPVSEAIIRIVLAHALYAFGEHRRAEQQLSLIETLLPRTASAYFEYLYLLTRAFFLLRRGAWKSSREALSRAMGIGRRQGFATLQYFWLPSVMSRLCAEALEAGIAVDYVQSIIQKLGLVPDDRSLYSEQWPRSVKIYAFGRLQVLRDGRPLEFPAKAPRRIIALLRLLVASGRNGVSDERAADLLWPDADGDAALQSLTTSIHRLRQLLGHEKAVQRRDGRVKLNAGLCWVDAHAFEALLEQAAGGPKPVPSFEDPNRSIENALLLYKDAFLSESIETWVVSYRERLRQKYLGALARQGGHYEGQGRFDQAVECYQKGLEIDNLAEELYYRTMKCYTAAGRQAEAVACYMKCKRILFEVLGVEPSPKTENLFRTLGAGPK